MSPTSKLPSPIGRLISEHLATLRPDSIPVLADPAHWAASCICKPTLHAVSHIFACSWRAGALTLSAQPDTHNRSVGCKPEIQVRVVKLDHRKFGDVHPERRSTMTLPPLTAEVSLYKSSGHYRSASSMRRTSGIANRSSPLIGRCPARIVAQSISASRGHDGGFLYE